MQICKKRVQDIGLQRLQLRIVFSAASNWLSDVGFHEGNHSLTQLFLLDTDDSEFAIECIAGFISYLPFSGGTAVSVAAQDIILLCTTVSEH